MLADITSVRNALIELKAAEDGSDFESILYNLRGCLKTLETDSTCLKELEQRAYYPINKYSDKETRNNMDAARKRVIEYLEEIVADAPAYDHLLTILDNYYLFFGKSSGTVTPQMRRHPERTTVRNKDPKRV